LQTQGYAGSVPPRQGPSLVTGAVVRNAQCAPRHFLMALALPTSFATPAPGQFVMVRARELRDPLLGRPLSVHGFTRRETEAELELLYRVVGRGTALLARMAPGERLDVVGPLGTPFTIDEGRGTAVLIAGGIGVVPLVFLASHFSGRLEGAGRLIFYAGARQADGLVGLQRLESIHAALRLSTDDGSRGMRCAVTELLARDLERFAPGDTMIYACGPFPMLLSLAALLEGRQLPCQVALEARMACGVGACLGCSVEVTAADGTPRYVRVCREGPVFDLRAVAWRQCRQGGPS